LHARSLNGIRPPEPVVQIAAQPDEGANPARELVRPLIFGYRNNAGTLPDLQDGVRRASAAAKEHRTTASW